MGGGRGRNEQDFTTLRCYAAARALHAPTCDDVFRCSRGERWPARVGLADGLVEQLARVVWGGGPAQRVVGAPRIIGAPGKAVAPRGFAAGGRAIVQGGLRVGWTAFQHVARDDLAVREDIAAAWVVQLHLPLICVNLWQAGSSSRGSGGQPVSATRAAARRRRPPAPPRGLAPPPPFPPRSSCIARLAAGAWVRGERQAACARHCAARVAAAYTQCSEPRALPPPPPPGGGPPSAVAPAPAAAVASRSNASARGPRVMPAACAGRAVVLRSQHPAVDSRRTGSEATRRAGGAPGPQRAARPVPARARAGRKRGGGVVCTCGSREARARSPVRICGLGARRRTSFRPPG